MASIKTYVVRHKIKLLYSLFGAVAYVLFLLVSLPATFVLSQLTLPKNITFASVTGTIWSGQAKQLRYASVELGNLRWRLSPFSLLIGELTVDVAIINGKDYFRSEMTVKSSVKMDLDETEFSWDLASLQNLTYGLPVAYAGKISGDFPLVMFEKNKYVILDGKLSLSRLQLTSPQQQSFGDLQVSFQAEKDGSSSGRIKDSGGPLDIRGQIKLFKDAKLNLSAKLAARKANSDLDKMLAFLGQKDATGRIQFKYDYQF